ncbi:MAG: hypothetical protein PHC51_01925 [bacterium]|nr:hypothetical protein [bacterium]
MVFTELKEQLLNLLEPNKAEAGLKTADSSMPGKDELRAMVRETMQASLAENTAIIFKSDSAKKILETTHCGSASSLLNETCNPEQRALVNEKLQSLEQLRLTNGSAIKHEKGLIYLDDSNTFAANSASLDHAQSNQEGIAKINSRFIAYREGTQTTDENAAVMPALAQTHADMRAYIELCEDVQKGEISVKDLKDFLQNRIKISEKSIKENNDDDKSTALLNLYQEMRKSVASHALASLNSPSGGLEAVANMPSDQQSMQAVTMTGKAISQLQRK